ncbi:MAG: hypothetical protein WDN06_09070 [Asticcacaulis sp.]
MWASVAGFELNYQLRSPTFWVSFIIFLLLGFAMMAAPQISIVAGANVHKNAPIVILVALTALTTFFMFVTTAFGANVIIRDQENGLRAAALFDAARQVGTMSSAARWAPSWCARCACCRPRSAS